MNLFDYDDRGNVEMAKNKIQSVEPNIADLANGWLKKYKLDYKLEQEGLNDEIDRALNDYHSKNGGDGGNRPDCKLLLQDKELNYYPILIEYKGYGDKLVKKTSEGIVDNVATKDKKTVPNYKNINSYAVNGAVHYAQALLHLTSYRNIIAIGMTGYKDEQGKLYHEIGVYFVSENTFAYGIEVGKYTDFSFLSPEYFDEFIAKVKEITLPPEEREKLKEKRDRELDIVLKDLNNDIFNNEKGLSERDRVYLIAATIMVTLGIPGKVRPLDKSELTSFDEDTNRDGDIILRKVEAFLVQKNLPDEKRGMIIRTLQNTLTSGNLNKVKSGETQLKRIFTKIVDNLGIYYKMKLATDFTGKLFNEMYRWLGFTQDQLNDVVLTPFYVCTLLVRLCKVKYNSYVWDFATGSAGLLVAAMNEMLDDAKKHIHSPKELAKYEAEIKAEHLLGVEILPDVYMLAVLNMIMMGDGSSGILNEDSLTTFDGNYGYGKTDEKFPADAFVLNPPYSAKGNGMVFVERALGMMNHGYGAIIIQNSAGSGKAIEYNKRILQHSTLLASIKMPKDLFIGKSNVQTYVYVFKVGEVHNKDCVVKFIDFSNDGYARSGRKKSKKKLVNKDHARERYQELVNLVLYGKEKLQYYTAKEYYEGHIDPENGADWNQTVPIDIKPTEADFRYTVEEYLVWKLGTVIRDRTRAKGYLAEAGLDKSLAEEELQVLSEEREYKEFRVHKIFEKIKTKKIDGKVADFIKQPQLESDIPLLTAGINNNGLSCYAPREKCKSILQNVISVSANGENSGVVFFQSLPFAVLQDAFAVKVIGLDKITENEGLFLAGALRKLLFESHDWQVKANWTNIKDLDILLPIQDNLTGPTHKYHDEGYVPDWDYMERYIDVLMRQTAARVM